MATLRSRKTSKGETRWQAIVRVKGAPNESKTFRTKTKASRWAKKVESAIREGKYFSTREAQRRTLSELIDRYVEDDLAQRPKGGEKLESQLERWDEELGDFALADVTPAKIADVKRAMLDETTYRGSKRSPATVNRYIYALSGCFEHAVNELGWIEVNPVRKVKKCEEPNGRVRFLDDDEREALLAACRAEDEDLYLIVLFALCTGARQAEILRLKWQDIDLHRGRATVHETKTGERRSLPLTGALLDALRERAKVRRIDNDHVFPGKIDGEHRWFPRRRWNRALDAAEIDDFRFHDLRHTAASYLAMNGCSLTEIGAVLGHKTAQTTQRYAHLAEDHLHAKVADMTDAFGLGGEA